MKIPKRIQRLRAKGAKQPPNTRYCGRPSKYANNHKVETMIYDAEFDKWFDVPLKQAHENAVEDFLEDMSILLGNNPAYYDDLFNFDYLSCFCPPELPCHVDAIIQHMIRHAAILDEQNRQCAEIEVA